MEVQMPARRHGDAAGLKGKPLAAPDGYPAVIDRRAEDAAGQRHFAGRQRSFSSGSAAHGCIVRFDVKTVDQRASPAA